MDKIFGLPVGQLASGLGVVLAVCALVIGIYALRNRNLFKMGVRNIMRRPAQTGLIITGLMLATLLISSALVTGDTMSQSVKKSALTDIGLADVTVAPRERGGTVNYDGSSKEAGEPVYLQESLYKKIVEAADGDPKHVDGVAGVLAVQLPASVGSSRNLPNLTLTGIDERDNRFTGAFGKLKDGSKTLAVSELRRSDDDLKVVPQVYLNAKAAEALEAGSGDEFNIYLQGKSYQLQVAGVISEGGRPATGPVAFMSLAEAQAITGLTDRLSTVYVSGLGDGVEGAAHTKAIEKTLAPVLKGTDYSTKPVKKDALENAETTANTFTSIFMIFGQFSMAAGVMLIFLIFVMLAAERRIELGVMRALGSQRQDIVKVFVFEGLIYAVISSAVGALLGMVVGYGMVTVIAGSFPTNGGEQQISFAASPASIFIAYAAGLLATFAVVMFSAWRTGRFNIVLAMRDLVDEKAQKKSIARLVGAIALIAVALFSMISSYGSHAFGLLMFGFSALIIGSMLLAQRIGANERAAYTLGGATLLAAWLAPGDFIGSLLGAKDWDSGMEMFFLSGISLVAGSTWVILHNSDLLVGGVRALLGRIKGITPVLQLAINYPMKSRSRTGLVLSMFSLVVFTIVFMSALLASIAPMWDDFDNLAAGYELQANTGFSNPAGSADEVRETIAASGKGIEASDIKSVSAASAVPIRLRQADAGAKVVRDADPSKKWGAMALIGVDRSWGDNNRYPLIFKDERYGSDREVWQALAKEKDVVIAHASMVPARNNYNMGSYVPPLSLKGIYREDKKLPVMYIDVRSGVTLPPGPDGKSPQPGVKRLRVIGVVGDTSLYVGGILTGQETLETVMGGPVPATTYYFDLAKGANEGAAADGLSRTFFENGMSVTESHKLIDEAMTMNMAMNRLMQGFMALGLVIGIAALGVIAARSVVERRRAIGMLRAIGFRRAMVQGAFLLENSFVVLLAVFIGSALAITVASNVIGLITQGLSGAEFTVPWFEIAAIGLGAYGASLLTTYLPSRRAAAVFPAEALRYE